MQIYDGVKVALYISREKNGLLNKWCWNDYKAIWEKNEFFSSFPIPK